MQDDFNLEETVKVYLRIRNAIEEMEERHKEELKALRSQYEIVGNSLLNFCNSQNLDSVKTPVGTVSRRISHKYQVHDWASLHQVIKENDAFYLLEKRIHNGNMRQFLEENPDIHPPGLQSISEYAVQVRKPTK